MTSFAKKENTTAASSAIVAASDESRDEGGFLILETNYRVYAYTGWYMRQTACSARPKTYAKTISLVSVSARLPSSNCCPEFVYTTQVTVSEHGVWSHYTRERSKCVFEWNYSRTGKGKTAKLQNWTVPPDTICEKLADSLSFFFRVHPRSYRICKLMHILR
jgi:hypothetical protein